MKQYIFNTLASAKLRKLKDLIEVPKDSSLGDYSLPCFSLAKKYKKSPIEIAKDLASTLKPTKEIEKIEAAGPYVNFFINKTFLAQETLLEVKKQGDKYGGQKIKETAFIEIASPNTNKPLHVGHIRNIVLGQSTANILSFMGNKVVKTCINNDRGIHICKSMVAYGRFGNGDTPEKAKIKPDHFVGAYYVKYSEALKDDPSIETEAKECLRKWEDGDKNTTDLWKKMNNWALTGFNETYKKFDLKFDKQEYESKIYKEGKKIVEEGIKKKAFIKKKDGSVSIDLSKEKLGEKILLRSDGTSIYVTQDLYLAELRHNDIKFDKGFYVVATEQNYHFSVLFTLLKKLGHKWADKLAHLNYGMVNLESGRMKSREGTVIDADDLVDEMTTLALNEIKKRHKDLSENEAKKRAHHIVMAAIRYYFLKVERLRDVTFKPKESLQFEGDTGPYLLYSYARAKSILRKAKSSKKLNIKVLTDPEKELVTSLSSFPNVVQHSYENLAPNLIANYTYDLAKKFNEFYHKSKVIGSNQESFRLSLVSAFAQVIKNALRLLGIRVIEKM